MKSGSVPFTGNAIELVNSGGGKNKDFTATYSINVVGSQGKMVNNLQSVAAAVVADTTHYWHYWHYWL